MDLLNTHYHTLCIKNDATEKEIKEAHRILTKLYHTDLKESSNFLNDEARRIMNEKFQAVNDAYQVLGDKISRKNYDILIEKRIVVIQGESEPVTSRSNHPPIEYDTITQIFHFLHQYPALKLAIAFLVGMVFGDKCVSKMTQQNQTEVAINTVEPVEKLNEWYSDADFDDLQPNQSILEKIQEINMFQIEHQNAKYRITGYYFDRQDSVETRNRVRNIAFEILDSGLEVRMKQAPKSSTDSSIPISRDINLEQIEQ